MAFQVGITLALIPAPLVKDVFLLCERPRNEASVIREQSILILQIHKLIRKPDKNPISILLIPEQCTSLDRQTDRQTIDSRGRGLETGSR